MFNDFTMVMIIRFHYDTDDKRFEWRFQWFKDAVLPRILAQTYDKFDIAIRCNPAHNKLFRDLHPRIFTFNVEDENIHYKPHGRKMYFQDHIPWSAIDDQMDRYDIQMGLDSDDLIHPDYVKIIKENVVNHIKSYPGKSLHLSFQPILFRLDGNKERPMIPYTPERGSAFLAFYQPDKNNYKFIYERSHISFYKIADRSIVIGQGYCSAVAHKLNESTGK